MGRMRVTIAKVLFAGFLAVLPGMALNVKLYLTDGTYQVVREYKVLADRIRYYSVERSDWEEIPLSLVDLKKTEAVIKASAEEDAASEKAEAEERQAIRAEKKEIAAVPGEPGVYRVGADGSMSALPQAELKVVNNKRRSILKAITPIPIVTGKSHVEMDGMISATRYTDPRPEFYFRLAKPEQLALVRVELGKNVRILERWEKLPVVNQILTTHDVVETFRRQVSEGLYKVWPMEPLPPGEYAWIEFTPEAGNTQAWDFSIVGDGPPTAATAGDKSGNGKGNSKDKQGNKQKNKDGSKGNQQP